MTPLMVKARLLPKAPSDSRLGKTPYAGLRVWQWNLRNNGLRLGQQRHIQARQGAPLARPKCDLCKTSEQEISGPPNMRSLKSAKGCPKWHQDDHIFCFYLLAHEL